MRKKICAVLLCLVMTFALCACGTEAVVAEPEVEDTQETEVKNAEVEEVEDIIDEAIEETQNTDIDEAESQLSDYLNSDLVDELLESGEEYIGVLENLDIKTVVSDYLANKNSWIACLEKEAYVFYFDGVNVSITHLVNEDGTITITAETGEFVLGEDSLSIIASIELNFTWELVQEGENISLVLVDAEGNIMTLYQPNVESEEEAIELAEKYLENEKNVDEISDDDISTLLAGYEGVSIVDAFIAAGLNPSLENRGIFAEKLGIENYRGTAKQNLYMIEAMGGIVK